MTNVQSPPPAASATTGRFAEPRGAMFALAGLDILAAGHAGAQEIEPNDFIALPAGTNLALGYYIYGDDTQYSFANGPTYKAESGQQINVAVARYVYYTEIGGLPAGFELYQAFGAASGGQIGGEKLNNTFGAQNVSLGAFIWPYADQKDGQYLVAVAWLYPPTGTYDSHSLVNLGDNRWRGDMQIGWEQSIGSHFSYDLGGDTMFYGDNNNGFPSGQRLTQTPTYRVQSFVNWRWTPTLQTSFGYEGFFGGVQSLNAVRNGNKTEEQRLRATASYFITPALQVLLEFNHDVAAVGGFKQDFGATIRVLYAF